MRSASGAGCSTQNSRKNGNSSVRPTPALIGEAPRRQPIELAAPEKAEIARAEEGDELVHHLRIVDRVMQPEAGKAGADRQGLVDLGAAEIEQARRIGDGRRHAVAHDVDDHRPLEIEAEVKELKLEQASRRLEERLVGPEADVAPTVEIEIGDRCRKLRRRRVERHRGEVAGALHHILVAEARIGRFCRIRRLRQGRAGKAQGERRKGERRNCDGARVEASPAPTTRRRVT